MQIVIDIDENLYTRLFDNGENDVMDMRRACVAIRKGTILPKGHGRLKDIDALESQIESVSYGYDWESGENLYAEEEIFLADDIWNAPTIIEADEEVD